MTGSGIDPGVPGVPGVPGDPGRSDPPDPSGLSTRPPAALSRLLAGRAAGLVAGLVPVAGGFGVAGWMLATGTGSFTGLIGFIGVIVVSLLAGVYPVLLLASSRRRGEYATARGRVRGNPFLLVTIYLLSLAIVFTHALVIWDDPWRRTGGLLAGVGFVILTVAVWRGGAFRPRLVVEIRAVDDEPADRAYFSMTAAGRPSGGGVTVTYADGTHVDHDAASGQIADYPSFRTAAFHSTDGPVHDLKVWLHHVTFTGDSFPLQARASLDAKDGPVILDVGITTSQVVVVLDGDPGVVRVEMEDQADPAATPGVIRG
jgi:hypothetical protein